MSLALTLPFIVSAAHAADGSSSGAPVLGGLTLLVLACAALVAVRRAWGLFASAVSGLGIASYLVVQHHAAKAGVGDSACNINAALSCDKVNTSDWSEIGGTPIALLGAGYFAAMAFLAFQHTRGKANGVTGLLTALAGVAVAYDVFLAWASSQIGALCVMCAATWALNVILLVGSVLEARKEEGGITAAMTRGVGAYGMNAAIVGLAMILVGNVTFKASASKPAAGGAAGGESELAGLYEQASGRIEFDGTEPVRGPADARFTLVEWADFECPHCALMVTELEGVLADNPDVKLLFKHYPISGLCNANVDGVRHENACSAAAAADCAGKQNAFYELSHKMFKNQEYLAPDDIRFLAKELQLDMPSFEACWADPATMDGVRSDVTGGNAAGVTGTPAVYLRGAFGDQWVRLKGGRAEITALLAAARSGKPLPAPAPAARE